MCCKWLGSYLGMETTDGLLNHTASWI